MKKYAIALCRVSTAEQKLNNSLSRQQENVLNAAKELGVEILKEWSGDVSSKAGTNVGRKDIKEMLAYCRKYKAIKFLIVDEPDRFMRSVEEAFHFEVEFRMIGVKIWYANDKQLNTDDMHSKLLRFTKYFGAEASNEERIRKSIDGHKKALDQGRYTFPSKPGYMKGSKPGVHEWHPTESEPWQQALKEVANGYYTPSEALKRLNKSNFTKNRAPMKIDKFIKFITDSYYHGVIEINKQVKAKCEDGQHIPMITSEEHECIIKVVTGRKARPYKRRSYNPDFPMNKLLLHDCEENSKFTGSYQSNGHGGKYPKYRCRTCGKQFHRDNIHRAINNALDKIEYTGQQREQFVAALANVWREKQQDNLKRVKSLQKRREGLLEEKSGLIRELSRVESDLKEDITDEINRTKDKINALESDLDSSRDIQSDLIEFVKFALEYTNKLKDDWWNLNQEERAQCQQLLFPAGIIYESSGKVSTTSICPLYRLATNKKDLRESRKSLLVELQGIAPWSI